jgi:hypothetical protein
MAFVRQDPLVAKALQQDNVMIAIIKLEGHMHDESFDAGGRYLNLGADGLLELLLNLMSIDLCHALILAV